MEICRYIEHTLLKPDAAKEDLKKLFDEAVQQNFYGVCVNPVNVNFAREYLKNSGVKIVTVCGFPLGANTSEVKAFEAQKAIADGADEVDMVINISALKNAEYDIVENDIKTVKKACGEHILKVIIETDLLTNEEIKKACELAVSAGADFVKTSTGFVKDGVGAKPEDVELMYKTVSPFGLRVKASGGVRDIEKAKAVIEKGASRIGTSSSIKIIEG